MEKYIPMETPPGLVLNGTMYQRRGRWAGGDLARFLEDGSPAAITAAITLTTQGTGPATEPVGAFAYNNGAAPVLLVGTTRKMLLLEYSFGYPASPHTWTDISPTPAIAADVDWWQFAWLSNSVIAVSSLGSVYASVNGAAATDITPDLATYTGVVVTPENFLMLLRTNTVETGVQWASQGTTNIWTPSSSNSAGSLPVPSTVPLLAARVVGQSTLLWSQNGVRELVYIGAPLYYGLGRHIPHCGLIAPNAVAVFGNEAAWMGPRGFYRYNGYAQPLPCDIADAIFPNLNRDAAFRIFTQVVSERDEVWWYWPSGANTTPDQAAIYNYRLNAWSKGSLARATGVSAGAWLESGATTNDLYRRTVPVSLTALGAVWEHEHDESGVMGGAYIESGPILGDDGGNKYLHVRKWVPDNNTNAADVLTLYAGTWPKIAESNQSFAIPPGGGVIDVSGVAGRYIRFKQTLTDADSRTGTPRAALIVGEGR